MKEFSKYDVIRNLGLYQAKMSHVSSIQELANIVEKTIEEFIPTEWTGLYLFNPQENKLKLLFARGFTEEEKKAAEDTAMERHPGKIFREKIEIHIPDVDADEQNITVDSPRSFHVKSRLYLPVMDKDECVGTFGVTSSQKNRFSPEDIEILRFICQFAGVVYSNIMLEKETKRVLDELRIKERAINSSRNGIIITDARQVDNPMIYANPAFSEITGYAINELLGKNCRILQGDDKDQPGLLELRKAMKENRPCKVTLKNYRKDGTLFWNELSISPILNEDGVVTNYVGVQSDITSRKEIESQLNELKAFYETTLDDLSGQVAVFDKNFKYLYVNSESVSNPEIRKWLIGKDDYEYCEFRSIDKSVADKRREKLNEAKKEKKTIRFEEEFKRVDGSVKFFERKITPIMNNRGEAERFVAYGIDISEIKSLVKNLEYSNKALMDFAYIASHDLREPLRKISAFGSLLNKSLKGKIDEDNKENLDFMIDGAKRMQQMVDDLLHYSRITTRAKSYSVIDLDELLHEIINFDLAQIIEDNNARIIIENEFGKFKGEKTQIKQLFQNLIGNGIKYRKKSEDPVISLRSMRTSTEINVQIEDNGIGIDEKYRDQIFEMFKRLHSKEEYEGSGIGLAVCKKIVELYNGELNVTSEPGKGSVFILKLPVGD